MRNVGGPGILAMTGVEMRIARIIALAVLVAALPASSVAASADCAPCALAAAAPGCHAPPAADAPQLGADCSCCPALACAGDSSPSPEAADQVLPSGHGFPAIPLAGTTGRALGAADLKPLEPRTPPGAARLPLYALHGIYLI